MLPIPGVLEPVPGHGLVGIRGASAFEILDLLGDPLFERVEQLAHRHVVLVDDLPRRIAIGEHGVEAFADLPHLGRNGVPLHSKMNVPVEVEVIVEVVPHERLPGKFLVEKLVEEGDDLLLVFRPVQVRSHAGEIDPLAEIVVAPLLQSLKEDSHAFFRAGPPILGKQSPEVERNGVLLGEGDVDHRERRAFALIDARQKERHDRVLDIVVVEIARNRTFELGEGGGDVVRHPFAWGVRRLRRGGRQRCGPGAGQKGSSV